MNFKETEPITNQESAQYDEIAEAYAEDVEGELGNKFIFDPALEKIMGDLRGLKIMDLACGDGYFSRKMQRAGAEKVIGIDISKGMIDLAKKRETDNPQGIEYLIGDARDLPEINKFNIVLGKYLLHYSETKDEISQMSQSIYRNLKPGSRFIGLLPYFENKPLSNPKYGFTQEAEMPLKEGQKVKVTVYKDKRPTCTFYNNYWKQSTYQAALENAGFQNIVWHQLRPTREGIKEYGQDFWQDYIDNPNHIIIEATKPA